MKNTKVAIIGCGEVTNGHLSAWKKINSAKVVAVSDLNLDLAKATAKRWGIEKSFANLSDLIGQTQVDIVDICTPPHTHASIAIEAMDSGANVLIEKPMTARIEDAEAIVSHQKNLSSPVKVGIVHNWLFERVVLQAQALVEQGFLGQILGIEVEAINTKYDSMAAKKDHWCHSLPGGRFSEMLAHPIYLTMNFLGDTKVVAVQRGKCGTYPWMASDELCVFFKSGERLGRAYASFNAPREAIFIRIYGSEAILQADVINAVLTKLPRRQTTRFNRGYDSIRQAVQLTTSTIGNVGRIVSGRWRSGHDECIRLFAESVLNNSKPPVTAEEGFAVAKVVDEACQLIIEAENDDVSSV